MFGVAWSGDQVLGEFVDVAGVTVVPRDARGAALLVCGVVRDFADGFGLVGSEGLGTGWIDGGDRPLGVVLSGGGVVVLEVDGICGQARRRRKCQSTVC